jgi:hypothetical protein
MGVKFIFDGVKSACRQVCNLLLIGSHTYGMLGSACAIIFYRAVIPNGIFFISEKSRNKWIELCIEFLSFHNKMFQKIKIF